MSLIHISEPTRLPTRSRNALYETKLRGGCGRGRGGGGGGAEPVLRGPASAFGLGFGVVGLTVGGGGGAGAVGGAGGAGGG
ncbi:hypothetical protein ACVGWQ_13150, partial [Enterobacter hormaechei]